MLLTERSSAWQNACFGSKRPQVRVLPFRPKIDLLSKRQLVGHTEVDRQGLYKCSTLVKFKVLCGKAAGIRHRTKHNLGDDWGVSLKDMKVLKFIRTSRALLNISFNWRD